MATVSDYLKEALRKINILAEGETPSAEQGAAALATFNDLLGMIRDYGYELGAAPTASTTDTVVMDDGDRMPFKYLLAAHLATDFNVPAPPSVGSIALEADTRFRRKGLLANPVRMRVDHLPAGPAGNTFDILTGR